VRGINEKIIFAKIFLKIGMDVVKMEVPKLSVQTLLAVLLQLQHLIC